jgi:outer membrane protein assembly factor BamA
MEISSGGKLPVPQVTRALHLRWSLPRYRRTRASESARVRSFAFLSSWILLAALQSSLLFAQTPKPADVQEGDRVEQILVSGLNRVQEPVVLRQMKSQVGGLYSASNIARDHERLDRMGLFSGIAIEATPGTNGVILHVALKETAPYFIYPAISVTGEQGLTVGAGLKSTNFLGSGASASIAARGGGATEFEVLIASAWRPTRSWWWKTDYFLKDRFNELDDFNEVSNELELQLGRQLTNRFRVGGRFHYLAVKSDVSGITLSPNNLDKIPGLGAVAEFDSRDSWTNARRGWQNSVDALFNRLASDEKYWTFNVDVRRYQPLHGRHGLAINSLLTLQTGTVGVDIPVHEDFHIGGTNSLRGWNIDARHGKDQFLNTFEYRFDLLKVRGHSLKGFNYYYGLQLDAFADTGTAWNTEAEFTKNFIAGGGFGIRVIVPYVNVIRIDFGFGQAHEGVILHFGIMDKAVYERRRVR